MKTKRKALTLVFCAMILVGATFLGTLAYLTDSQSVTNTFTVGQVHIELDEADVNELGVVDGNERVKENTYHLLPGHTYVKDPTVTVEGGSEECYVRMLVEFNYSKELDDIYYPNKADLTKIFNNYDSQTWILKDVVEDEDANTRTYEFWYKEKVAKSATDTELDALFESFTVPKEFTNEDLASLITYATNVETGEKEIASQFTIKVTAHAIQADGFATADAAWDAWN